MDDIPISASSAFSMPHRIQYAGFRDLHTEILDQIIAIATSHALLVVLVHTMRGQKSVISFHILASLIALPVINNIAIIAALATIRDLDLALLWDGFQAIARPEKVIVRITLGASFVKNLAIGVHFQAKAQPKQEQN